MCNALFSISKRWDNIIYIFLYFIFIVFLNLSPDDFFVSDTCYRVRQRGTEDVMNHLSKEVLNEKVKSVLFLMPCHATPYYSTLHRNIPMRFLDCSPRFELRKSLWTSFSLPNTQLICLDPIFIFAILFTVRIKESQMNPTVS